MNFCFSLHFCFCLPLTTRLIQTGTELQTNICTSMFRTVSRHKPPLAALDTTNPSLQVPTAQSQLPLNLFFHPFPRGGSTALQVGLFKDRKSNYAPKGRRSFIKVSLNLVKISHPLHHRFRLSWHSTVSKLAISLTQSHPFIQLPLPSSNSPLHCPHPLHSPPGILRPVWDVCMPYVIRSEQRFSPIPRSSPPPTRRRSDRHNFFLPWPWNNTSD